VSATQLLNDKSMRLATVADGDDTTLSRYVRNEHAGMVRKPRKHQPRIPGLALAFVLESRTKFGKSVRQPDDMKTLLVSGHSNVKIGRDVRKGKFKGRWIYTLSLEERKTCPSSCDHWQTCYGNNMPFAKRIDHTNENFLPLLERNIQDLLNQAKRRRNDGILIRLHALGDFYSTEYVNFWSSILTKYPDLAIFGYTARLSGTALGWMIHEMNTDFKGRCMIRFSNGGYSTMSTVPIQDEKIRVPGAFICPEQTAKTQCCATCGACWSTTKNVAFLDH
jgi:hypothetical protein